mmetsp:Transcript_13145/g.27829  ORF Transcript_13145/g.27829 Transcript_13145/m.27829 type:complete len:137 (+) Transcript_13145:529-939(+)
MRRYYGSSKGSTHPNGSGRRRREHCRELRQGWRHRGGVLPLQRGGVLPVQRGRGEREAWSLPHFGYSMDMTRLWHAGLWGAPQQVLKREADSSDTVMKAKKVMETVGEVDREVWMAEVFFLHDFHFFQVMLWHHNR